MLAHGFRPEYRTHLIADVPAPFLVGAVLLIVRAKAGRADAYRTPGQGHRLTLMSSTTTGRK